MQGWLYQEGSFGVFLLVTLLLGGGAAALAGRAVAATWRSPWQVLGYMLLLGFGVRFIHYALFNGTLLSLHYYLVDVVLCVAAGYLGFRFQRARQMATQYRWINERSGAMRWRRKAP
jgi:hypothetical protein